MLKRLINVCLIVLLFCLISGCSINNASFKEGPNANDTLVWNLSATDVTSWDPHISSSGVMGDITRQIFEGLTVLGEEGYELGVAESYTVSANDVSKIF